MVHYCGQLVRPYDRKVIASPVLPAADSVDRLCSEEIAAIEKAHLGERLTAQQQARTHHPIDGAGLRTQSRVAAIAVPPRQMANQMPIFIDTYFSNTLMISLKPWTLC
jgi:hypothetical protein